MSSPLATVLIPTHDHAPLLRYSLESARNQTVRDIEIFVVGDGVGDDTRAALAPVLREDPRVRFFDNPKGPRHGEVHRHRALQAARGRIVCYLSDDDLWFPDHVAHMLRLLAGADLARALLGGVRPARDGRPETLSAMAVVDLQDPGHYKQVLYRKNAIPLSAGAHTLAAYRRLPHGWRTTPEGIATDWYMWRQFLAQAGCRAVSTARPTGLIFPSPLRQRLSARERAQEMRRWYARVAQPDECEALRWEIVEVNGRLLSAHIFLARAGFGSRLRRRLAWRIPPDPKTRKERLYALLGRLGVRALKLGQALKQRLQRSGPGVPF